MNDLEKLRGIIDTSSLSDEDKNFWKEKVFKIVETKPNILKPILLHLENSSDEDELKSFTDFSKRKILAIESGDKEALERILKEEEEKLKTIN
ncbi:hypothetical protein HON59_02245 [bacterium]|jgi:hypothetical protein|nr:hypothetical protein [bacterium]MBT3729773.1 hypothetical protein [bacterium]MBT4894862.1 hypothetical protein [bacterium]